MPREYVPFTIMETTFLLGPRFKTLPATARCVYIALWARAFQERRERLPNWYDTRSIQDDCRLDTRSIRKALALLRHKCLIAIGEDKRITVCGVSGKAKRLAWKDGVSDAPTESQHADIEERERERERECPSPPSVMLHENTIAFCEKVRQVVDVKPWFDAKVNLAFVAGLKLDTALAFLNTSEHLSLVHDPERLAKALEELTR